MKKSVGSKKVGLVVRAGRRCAYSKKVNKAFTRIATLWVYTKKLVERFRIKGEIAPNLHRSFKDSYRRFQMTFMYKTHRT